MFLLQIQGTILVEKQKEFNQSLDFLMIEVSELCYECKKSENGENGRYQFNTYWKSKKKMDEFLKTDLFKAVVGAFKVLGTYEGTSIQKTLKK